MDLFGKICKREDVCVISQPAAWNSLLCGLTSVNVSCPIGGYLITPVVSYGRERSLESDSFLCLGRVLGWDDFFQKLLVLTLGTRLTQILNFSLLKVWVSKFHVRYLSFGYFLILDMRRDVVYKPLVCDSYPLQPG